MGNCVDKGDSNADGKSGGFAALMGEGNTTFEGKADGGKVTLAINGGDKTFELKEFEGEATDATTSWAGAIREADGVWTFDASAEGATTSETKTFTGELADGNVKLGHKFVGDIEELVRQGELAAKEDAPAEAAAE